MPEQREKTIDVLRRLKAQEDKPKPSMESYSFSKPPVITKREPEPVQIVNIPQRNIENLMHKIEELERKMKSGSQSYFDLYYDLKTAEQNFMREAERIKRSSFQIPDTTMRRIDEKMSLITRKMGMGAK